MDELNNRVQQINSLQNKENLVSFLQQGKPALSHTTNDLPVSTFSSTVFQFWNMQLLQVSWENAVFEHDMILQMS